MNPDTVIPQSVIDTFVGAAHGDFNTVKTLSNQHPEIINARASWNELALEAAAQTGRVDIAGYLLEAGAPLDLCTAVVLDRKAEVESWLQHDPTQINTHGAHGLPLLYFAAIPGNVELAELLLAHGAEVNAGDGSNTPIHGAILFEQSAMVGWLLDHGARLDLKDFNGKTPLEVAQSSQNAEILQRLQEVSRDPSRTS